MNRRGFLLRGIIGLGSILGISFIPRARWSKLAGTWAYETNGPSPTKTELDHYAKLNQEFFEKLKVSDGWKRETSKYTISPDGLKLQAQTVDSLVFTKVEDV